MSAVVAKVSSPGRRRRWMRVRVGILGFLVLCGAGAVVRRAYELQIERAPALREMAEEQYLRSVRLAPKRGTVYDRNGAELAVSVDVDSVWASPSEIRRLGGDPSAVAMQLSALLGVDRERITRRLSTDRHFAWIKRHVTPEVAEQVRAADLPGVHLDREARRFYPNRELAAHVLGFANVDGQGIEGLELSLEERLRGSRHAVPAIRDRRGRVVYSDSLLDDTVGQGADVTLTIDRTIQRIAERELALAVQTYEAKVGSVVVLDPRTGEILAVADYPTFDPNDPGAYAPSHRRNRAVTDRFEPGS
ncbi:MAG: peptidoglycan glycosyltransferase, partial [Myxococcales bacterium]|nr:peptidoglycan glycosyltransferase [Myxococcales bacterium]